MWMRNWTYVLLNIHLDFKCAVHISSKLPAWNQPHYCQWTLSKSCMAYLVANVQDFHLGLQGTAWIKELLHFCSPVNQIGSPALLLWNELHTEHVKAGCPEAWTQHSVKAVSDSRLWNGDPLLDCYFPQFTAGGEGFSFPEGWSESCSWVLLQLCCRLLGN